jgi:hypothetical protein
MLQPGEPFPAEASSSSSASYSTSTSSSTTITSTTAAAATTTAAAAAAAPSHSTLSSGAIAGIVVGAAAVLSLAAALFFYIGRSKTLQSEVQRTTTTTQHLSQPPHGMYQSPSGQVFVPMKIDDSVRNSTIPYDIAPPQMYGRDALRPEGGVSVEEAHSLRSTNGSPGAGGGAWTGVQLGPYGQQHAAANPQA